MLLARALKRTINSVAQGGITGGLLQTWKKLVDLTVGRLHAAGSCSNKEREWGRCSRRWSIELEHGSLATTLEVKQQREQMRKSRAEAHCISVWSARGTGTGEREWGAKARRWLSALKSWRDGGRHYCGNAMGAAGDDTGHVAWVCASGYRSS
jgi:hypothetical protein